MYALVDPRDGRARYVGVTTRPLLARLAGHHSAACGRLRDWFADLASVGTGPTIVALEWIDGTSRDACEAECEWIAFLNDDGRLLNERVRANLTHKHTAGKSTAPHSTE